MAYIRKTITEFNIEANYGQGFEMVTCETSWGDAVKMKRTYRENEPGVRFRIKPHRVKKAL